MKKTTFELLSTVYKNGYHIHLKNEDGSVLYYHGEYREIDGVPHFVTNNIDVVDILNKEEINELEIMAATPILKPNFSVGDRVKTNCEVVTRFKIGHISTEELSMVHAVDSDFSTFIQFIEHDHDYYLNEWKEEGCKIEKLLPGSEGFTYKDMYKKLNEIIECLNSK